MSHSYRVNYQHITFHVTQTLLAPGDISQLHEIIAEDLKGLGAKNVCVGGVKDHVHIIANFVSLDIAQCVWHCKLKASRWLRSCDKNYYRTFHWQPGFAAFSVSFSLVPRVKLYIQNQYRHHLRLTYKEEQKLLEKKNGGFEE